MVNKVQILRSNTFSIRPGVGAQPDGAPYVNFADKQFGVVDLGGTPQDLVGVPFFSTLSNYSMGQPVNYLGLLYFARTSISAGAWNPLNWVPDISTKAVFQCGRLELTSATALSYLPFNGSLIKINGILYQIPSSGSGIAGLGNTGVFVNGVAGQNLAANTGYLVCAFNNAGTITADFVNNNTHSRSSTIGNEGVETLTSNNSRSLIGYVATNASAQFDQLRVLSWFNRRSKATYTGAGNAGGSVAVISFLTWADEAVYISYYGSFQCNQPSNNYAQIVFDGGGIGPINYDTVTSNTYYSSHAGALTFGTAEGAHSAALSLNANNVATSINFYNNVMIRG